MSKPQARYLSQVRINLHVWALWKDGNCPPTPATEQIQAVFDSGLLSPKLREAIELAYLDRRMAKEKYSTSNPTHDGRYRRIERELGIPTIR